MTISNKVPGYLCSKRSCNVNCFVNVWGVGKNYPLLEIASMTFMVLYPVAILNKGTSDLMQGWRWTSMKQTFPGQNCTRSYRMTLNQWYLCINSPRNVQNHSVSPGFVLSPPVRVMLGIVLGVRPPSAATLSVRVSCVFCLLALHTNHHAYNLHEPKCISGAGDAIHAESVHHHFPPWTQCPETEAKFQGSGHGSHHVIAAVAQAQWQTQRWGQDRALWKRRPKQ